MKAVLLLCLIVAGASGKATRRTLDPLIRERLFSGPRVVGGSVAEVGQFPYQVSLQLSFFGHYCGGNIVAPDVIVTAAHCVEGYTADSFTIVAGINDLNDLGSGQERAIAELGWHESFPGPGGLDNDVAYLRLAEPLELNDLVQLVKLPGEGITPSLEPGKCTVSGWGATDSSGSIYPDLLHFGEIQGLSDDDCQNLMDNLANPPFGVEFVPSSNFCAYTPEGGLNACFGDSGGPLVCESNEDGERYLFGVVSWGPMTCGEQGFPAIYTDVISFLPWIQENAGVSP